MIIASLNDVTLFRNKVNIYINLNDETIGFVISKMNVTETFSAITTNVDFEELPLNHQNPVELIIYITFEVLIAFFAFINNVMVILALWRFRSLRTPTNYFVASLAIADIAVAVFAIPSAILLRLGLSISNHDCGFEKTQPSVSEGVCLFIVSSVILLTQVSIFSLVIIAIDRFIAINYPFRYNVFMTSAKTRIGIIAAWVLGGLIGFVPELGWNKFAQGEPCNHTRCAFEEVISMEYMVYFNFFGCVLIPLIAMGVMYMFIFRSAKSQLRKIYFDVKTIKKKHFDNSVPETYNMSKNVNSFSVAPSRDEICESDFTCEMTTETMCIEMQDFDSKISPILQHPDPDSTTSQTINANYNANLPLKKSIAIMKPNKDAILACSQERRASFCNAEPRTNAEDSGMPRVKSHSFSASTNIVPSIRSKNSIRLKVKAMKNDDSCSIHSSRSTLYTSEHGVWSAATKRKSTQHLQRKMKRKRQLLKKEFRAARSLATVVGLFAICWLPLHILNTLTLFFSEVFQPLWLKDLAILLSHANSLVNPLLYAYKMRDFRNAFRKLLNPFCPAPDRDDISQSTNSNNSSCIKICCFVASRDELHSDERLASYDSYSNKTAGIQNNSNNNNSSIVTLETKKKKFPRLQFKNTRRLLHQSSFRNNTKTTLLEVDAQTPSAQIKDSIASSNDDIWFSTDMSECELMTNLINAKETTL